MAVYLLVPLETITAKIDQSVSEKILPSDRFELQNQRGWLINYSGTSVELSNFLNITFQTEAGNASVGSALIVSVSFYYGRGNKTMWEWLEVKLADK